MKKKAVTLLLSGVMVVSAVSYSFAATRNTPETKELGLNKREYIIEELQGDINGDKIKDRVLLIGEKENEDDIYNKSIFLKVVDGKSKKVSDIKINDFGGYEGKLFLGDFTGDKVEEAMIVTNTGGSGGMVDTRIISMKDNKGKIIFDGKDNLGINFKGKFADNFKAELKEDTLDEKLVIDLSAFKDSYIEQGIYDKNGKLLKETEPWTDPFSGLNPIDVDGDGVYELLGHQTIAGAYHANTISRLNSIFKYEDGEWKVKETEYTTKINFDEK
ncbi:hypothetical protein KQI42_04140 [Tissierella sp. MSJ-40]|uniref:Uncharacterized protein n=1 Tax=Tissierella simiarum TaxID=2841534 RepID=A0ABS6E413_9FIRM|nr:hypothetical protein [Tissierella simiarum]MBU5437185.1 hypothetical protein [Tissierella simiarum]